MSSVIHGIIHGKRIELESDPGIADGQTVAVIVTPLPLVGAKATSAAGMLAHLPEPDPDLEAVLRETRSTPCREVEE
ncbi:MAG: hypothetical protein K2R98_08885 [Gemmataceae bacterium]|nr:hypothetical protein [Gemmataceae bacterium]